METGNLLPTQHKSKVAQNWVYPVGAQIVSHALINVSQYQHILLYFGGFKMNAKQQEQIHVLSVRYTAPHMKMTNGNWWVDISAVPKSVAAKVKELLISKGLPYMCSWVAAEHGPVWLSRWKLLSICFDLNSQSLVLTEDRAL